MAEFPERIERIFITKEPNAAGCYAVTLYVNGEKRTVVVDDRFPYYEERGMWAFARPSRDEGDREIWSLIIEKVWAKIFGNY